MKKKKQRPVVERLQKHLDIFMKLLDLNGVTLGEHLGVSKQEISNIRNKKVVMSKTQYIAIRVIFEYLAGELGVTDEYEEYMTVFIDKDADRNVHWLKRI